MPESPVVGNWGRNASQPKPVVGPEHPLNTTGVNRGTSANIVKPTTGNVINFNATPNSITPSQTTVSSQPSTLYRSTPAAVVPDQPYKRGDRWAEFDPKSPFTPTIPGVKKYTEAEFNNLVNTRSTTNGVGVLSTALSASTDSGIGTTNPTSPSISSKTGTPQAVQQQVPGMAQTLENPIGQNQQPLESQQAVQQIQQPDMEFTSNQYPGIKRGETLEAYHARVGNTSSYNPSFSKATDLSTPDTGLPTQAQMDKNQFNDLHPSGFTKWNTDKGWAEKAATTSQSTVAAGNLQDALERNDSLGLDQQVSTILNGDFQNMTGAGLLKMGLAAELSSIDDPKIAYTLDKLEARENASYQQGLLQIQLGDLELKEAIDGTLDTATTSAGLLAKVAVQNKDYQLASNKNDQQFLDKQFEVQMDQLNEQRADLAGYTKAKLYSMGAEDSSAGIMILSKTLHAADLNIQLAQADYTHSRVQLSLGGQKIMNDYANTVSDYIIQNDQKKAQAQADHQTKLDAIDNQRITTEWEKTQLKTQAIGDYFKQAASYQQQQKQFEQEQMKFAYQKTQDLKNTALQMAGLTGTVFIPNEDGSLTNTGLPTFEATKWSATNDLSQKQFQLSSDQQRQDLAFSLLGSYGGSASGAAEQLLNLPSGSLSRTTLAEAQFGVSSGLTSESQKQNLALGLIGSYGSAASNAAEQLLGLPSGSLAGKTVEEVRTGIQLAEYSAKVDEANAKASNMDYIKTLISPSATVSHTDLQNMGVVVENPYFEADNAMRTDRTNNPIASSLALTKDGQIAKDKFNAEWINQMRADGIDFTVEQGHNFGNRATIKFNNPVDGIMGAISLLKTSAFSWYKKSTGKTVLTNIAGPAAFAALPLNNQVKLVAGIYSHEGGNGILKKAADAILAGAAQKAPAIQAGKDSVFASGTPLPGNAGAVLNADTYAQTGVMKIALNGGINAAVPAFAGGTVVQVGSGSQGKTVQIADAYGATHTYTNLGNVLVKNGDYVQTGNAIATQGNSGSASAKKADVYTGYSVTDKSGVQVDPHDYVYNYRGEASKALGSININSSQLATATGKALNQMIGDIFTGKIAHAQSSQGAQDVANSFNASQVGIPSLITSQTYSAEQNRMFYDYTMGNTKYHDAIVGTGQEHDLQAEQLWQNGYKAWLLANPKFDEFTQKMDKNPPNIDAFQKEVYSSPEVVNYNRVEVSKINLDKLLNNYNSKADFAIQAELKSMLGMVMDDPQAAKGLAGMADDLKSFLGEGNLSESERNNLKRLTDSVYTSYRYQYEDYLKMENDYASQNFSYFSGGSYKIPMKPAYQVSFTPNSAFYNAGKMAGERTKLSITFK